VAPIASALLVELLASILQHPLKHRAAAPAPTSSSSSSATYERDPPDHALGLVPHQIRGFLSSFQNMIIRGESYPCCSACSTPIVYAYKNQGWNFVKKALSDREYVAELSGLAEVQRRAEAIMAEEGFSEDGEPDDDGEAVLV
jgi:ubiquitin-like modifier-activating enzyme ATG7